MRRWTAEGRDFRIVSPPEPPSPPFDHIRRAAHQPWPAALSPSGTSHAPFDRRRKASSTQPLPTAPAPKATNPTTSPPVTGRPSPRREMAASDPRASLPWTTCWLTSTLWASLAGPRGAGGVTYCADAWPTNASEHTPAAAASMSRPLPRRPGLWTPQLTAAGTMSVVPPPFHCKPRHAGLPPPCPSRNECTYNLSSPHGPEKGTP